MLGLGQAVGGPRRRDRGRQPAVPLHVAHGHERRPFARLDDAGRARRLEEPRDGPPGPLAAGAAIAVDVLLRPTNVLAFLPVGVALGSRPRRWLPLRARRPPRGRLLCRAQHGGLRSIARHRLRRQLLRLRLPAMSPRRSLHCARWMPALFTPVVSSASPCPGLRRYPLRLSLAARWAPGSCRLRRFYSAYVCTHETWWYLRSCCPPPPPWWSARSCLRQGLGRSGARRSTPAVPGRPSGWRPPWPCGSILGWLGPRPSSPSTSGGANAVRAQSPTGWRRHVPADAVCVTMQASGAIFYYTPFHLHPLGFRRPRQRGEDRSRDPQVRKAAVRGPVPVRIHESHVLDQAMPGHWEPGGDDRRCADRAARFRARQNPDAMAASLLLDLSHTSHTRARTGIQRVCPGATPGTSGQAGAWPSRYRPVRARVAAAGPVGGATISRRRPPAGRRLALAPGGARLRGRVRAPSRPDAAPLRREAALGTGGSSCRRYSRRGRRQGALPALFGGEHGPRVALFHDAIALQFPEFTPALHLGAVSRPTCASSSSLTGWPPSRRPRAPASWNTGPGSGSPRTPPVAAITLGIDSRPPSPGRAGHAATGRLILCVGSIEGRKNHVALLDACESLWARERALQASPGRPGQPRDRRPGARKRSRP